ncbi:hypothetical protein [Acidipila sp. EB88]|nr:hypothetical protein [Acidipila sp. EB88]
MDLLAHFCVHLLETLFFLGLAGSLAVVSITAVADIRELFGKPRAESL